MSPNLIYCVVLASAIAHAGWNAIVKTSGDRLLMLASIRTVGLAVGVAVAFVVPLPSVESLPFLIAAAAVHYIYYALMIRAYSLGDLSQIYPIARGIAPLLVALLGAMFASEAMSAGATVAICTLSVGILALAVSGGGMGAKAITFAVGTGTAIAAYSFLGGLGIRRSGSLLGYIAWLEIITGIGMVWVAHSRRRATIAAFAREHWRVGLVAGVLAVGGYAIALLAMTKTAMAPIVALRETSIVFAALIGSVFLGEGFVVRRIFAAIAVAVGVLLLGHSAR